MAETRYPSVYIDRLGRQLTLWTKYGISDARALKLLRLWLGYDLVHLMDKKGRYTFHSFNAIRQVLGYPNLSTMLDDIRKSHSFVLLSCDVDPETLKEHNVYTQLRPTRELTDGLTMFYSPLWHEREEDDGEALPGSIPLGQKNSQNLDRLYSNTLDSKPTGSTAEAVAAGKAAAADEGYATLTIEQVATLEEQRLTQHIRDAKLYFRGLVGNKDDFQREPIDWLMKLLQQPLHPTPGRPKGYGLTTEEACEALEVLIDTELAPHFARDRQFMSPSRQAKPETRIYQVTNYVKRFSKDMVERAMKRWKKRAAERQRDQARRQEELVRLNRPLSPYEWQDAAGLRWMEDSRGNVMQVPAEAPPRPGESAMWNYVDQGWSG